MPSVKLTRRWGPHRANKSVEVSESEAQWLVRHNYAESTGDVRAPRQEAAAPGSHGADPLAGGDASRLRARSMDSTREKKDGPVNTVDGAPAAAYRAGYNRAAREREGEAGRDFKAGADKRAGVSRAPEGSPAAEQQDARSTSEDASPASGSGSSASGSASPASGSRSGDEGSERPTRRRGSRS